MVNILLVEDDPHINNINKRALASAGYSTLCATSARDCLAILEGLEVDLVILDIDLPDGNGLDVCKQIKAMWNVPILFLTAMGENSDVVKGLDAGGDDYMTKPYDLSVLVARVKARLRHLQPRMTIRTFGQLQIDHTSGIAYYNDKDLLLTKRELLILYLLADKKGEPVARDELYEKVWGTSVVNDYNALRILVSRVKTKLLKAECNMRILTERKKGYVLKGW